MSEQDILNTLIGEAGSNRDGMTAVAFTILNRSNKFGQTPTTVVKAPNQYTGYSAPGWAAKRAQNDPQVRALAKQVWDAVQTRSVPDPTKGGLNFRSDAAAAGLGSSPHGTRSIGGNTFQLGNSPSSALSAINTIAPPLPRSRPTPDASAYANSIVPTPHAGHVPYDFLGRGGRSAEINPNGTLKVPQSALQTLAPPNLPLNPAMPPIQQGGYYGPETDRWGPFSTGAVGGGAPSLGIGGASLRAPNTTAEGLAVRPVSSVPIDPMTGQPVSNVSRETPGLQAALNSYAAQRAAQARLLPSPTASGVVGNGMGASGSASLSPDLQAALNSYASNLAASRANLSPSPASSGAMRTTNGQAGSVAMQPGAVPQSVLNAFSTMSSRPGSLSASGSANGGGLGQWASAGLTSSPYIPSASGTTVANKDSSQLPQLPLSAYGPTPSTTAQAAITKQITVLNPDYTAWAFHNVGNDIKEGHGPSLNVQQAPPQYITKTITLPAATPSVPRPPAALPLTGFNGVNPLSQIMPNIASHFATTPAGHIGQLLSGEPVSGGILGFLNGLMKPPAAGMQSSPSVPSIPGPVAGTSFLNAGGVNTAGMTPAEISNAFRDALAGSSR